MKNLSLIVLLNFGLLIFACNQESESTTTSNQTTNQITTETNDVIDKDDVETVNNNEGDPEVMKYLIGQWKYDHSVVEMDGESMQMVSADHWVMHYKADGTFEETQTMVEGGETYTANDTYTLEGKTLKRKGLVAVEVIDINATEMTILSIGTKMIFKKIK
jgi:hypothetical protein